MAKDYLELSELLSRVQESVEDAFPDRYWVKGEISSYSPRANGHCYLALTETVRGKKVAESRAIIWSWVYPQLKAFFERASGQELRVGLSVLVQVTVHFSGQYGFTLYVDGAPLEGTR